MTIRLFTGVAALGLTPVTAMALGLDRSGQPVDVLFEEGNYFEFTVSRAYPSVDGEDLAIYGGRETGSVGIDYDQIGAGLKLDATDRLSFAFISGQPYAVDLSYPAGRSFMFGGTDADVDSGEINVLGRYKLNQNFSVHGGFRYTRLESDVTLSGAAYGGLSGYSANFEEDSDFGLVAGMAYEIPDIAFRVALTYFEGTEHNLRTTETVGGVGVGDLPAAALGLPFNPFSTNSTTTVETPDAINLDFRTGLNEKTLLFGQVRYAWYGDTLSSPAFFDALNEPAIPNSSLTEIEDKYSVELGVGRKLSERLSGSVVLEYEPEDDDDLVSPLAPRNGRKSVGLGFTYQATDQISVSGGVRYVWLGDAFAETGTPDQPRSVFEDNSLVGIGARIGYRF